MVSICRALQIVISRGEASYTSSKNNKQQNYQVMKKHERITAVTFSGNGHYKVTISYYRKSYTATITDMTLIDDYKDGYEIGRMNDLYDVVKSKAIG
jgi:phosphopentomutase